jgi:hypothetical protein
MSTPPAASPARASLILVAIAGAACSRSAPPAPSAEPTSRASLSAAAPSTAPKPPSLFVASDAGIREVGYDGATIRTLSRTPARLPRLVAGKEALVFYDRSDGQLRRLSLASGAETVVAALPRTIETCGPLHDHATGHAFAITDLDVHGDDGLVVDARGGAACLRLADKEDNPANVVDVQVDARIDLSSGHVVHAVAVGGDCRGARGKPAVPPCAVVERPRAPGAAPFPLASLGVASNVVEETVAPSGRWSLVAQPRPGGDLDHRALFLLDRQKRLVYPIVRGPFPPPLTAAQLAQLSEVPSELGALQDGGTLDSVRQSTVRWLEGDALLVDERLVVPELGGVDIPGEVAR